MNLNVERGLSHFLQLRNQRALKGESEKGVEVLEIYLEDLVAIAELDISPF